MGLYIRECFNFVELKNRRLEVGQRDTLLQEGSEEWSRELQASQLTSMLGKVTAQIIFSAITHHEQVNQRTRLSHNAFRKSRLCLTNLIFFYDQETCLGHEGKAMDDFYLQKSL